jgi:hypothetical protein
MRNGLAPISFFPIKINDTTWAAGQWSQQMVVMLYITIGLYEAMGLAIIAVGLSCGSMLIKIRNPKPP